MGQVQNGHLYIKYRSSSIKNEANEFKKLTDYVPLLFFCSIHSINSANLSQSWENQTWKFELCLLFSSSFITHNSRTIQCMQILYIPNDFSATGHFPFLVWCGVRAMTGGWWPQNCLQRHSGFLFCNFLDFCSRIPGVAHIVRPHPDCDEFASNQQWVSGSSTIVVFIYLVLKTNFMCNRRRCCASRYLVDLISMIAPIFGGE